MSGITADNTGRHSGLIKATTGAAAPWTLIKTLTASDDATLSFVNGTSDVVLDTTYDAYCFKTISVHATSGGTSNWLYFNGSIDSGSNYNVVGNSTAATCYIQEDGSNPALKYNPSYDREGGADHFAHQYRMNDAVADEAIGGTIYMYGLGSSTFAKHFLIHGSQSNNGTYVINYFHSGYLNTTSAIDAVQFKLDTDGDFNGTIALYGIT